MNTREKSIHPLLERVMKVVATAPEREAVVGKTGRSVSYGELKQLVSTARIELVKRGVKKGTRVLIAIPMSIELYALLLALFSLGGIAVFLDPWMKGKKMAEVIHSVKPSLLLLSPKLRWLAYLLPATRKISDWWVVKTLLPSEVPIDFADVGDQDTALITFTSGTSGKPKGADRTFGFLSAQMDALYGHLKREHPQRDYTNFPIVGLANLGVGNTVIIPQINLMKIHKSSPEEVKEHLTQQQASRMIVSPSLLGRAILAPNALRGLNEVFSGGAPIPFGLIESCIKTYSKIHFEAIFGSTEAEPVALTSFVEMKNKMGDPLKGVYAGIPESITHHKIIKAVDRPIDGDFIKEHECREGEAGELIVSGDHVNKGYFENEQAFEKNKVIDETGQIWHRMGDIGYKEGGALYLVGRLHRIMNHQGKEFHPYPFEFYLERKLGWTDTGYIQNMDGSFQLFVGGKTKKNEELAWQAATETGYPLNEVIFIKKNLPRDPRHRSKLESHALSKLKGKRFLSNKQ